MTDRSSQAQSEPAVGSGDDDQPSDQRSGDFSRDPVFDPSELFEVVARDDNVRRVLDAMREFIRRNDTSALERAVAIYVRSARARGEPIETVLGTLQTVANDLERDATPGFRQRDTPLRHVLLRGVLLAFYGADVVRREESARRGRVEHRVSPGDPSSEPVE
jgi:hypothetical protein